MKPSRQVQHLDIAPMEPVLSRSATLVDRYLGSSAIGGAVEYVGVIGKSGPHVKFRLADATVQATSGIVAEYTMLWHVLWIRNEPAAAITIKSSDQQETWPIAPGDSCFIPTGATVRASGDQLVLAISLTGDLPDQGNAGPPTHGIDQMFGHNRKTVSFLFGGIAVSRWKLTEPLRLTEQAQETVIVFALAGTLVIQTASAIDSLVRGQAALIALDSDVRIAPDGLGYLLVVESRAEADAIEELRAAGATDAEIALIVPRSAADEGD